MAIHYDLLSEPWIPAADPNGHIHHMGILDVFAHAHELRAITDPSPLVEYGLHRLLCVFLMDALRPETILDLEDLLAAGSFPMDRLRDYVALCGQEGASFDLFDDKRPFLQAPYSPKWDKEPKSAAYLDCTIPTGNNHVHFNHGNSETCLSYGEAARYLPACTLFVTAGAQGYPSGPNGAPPFFTLIKGNTLFETLVYTLIPTDEIPDFDSIPVFWRSSAEVVPKAQVYRTSWLYGMLFPSRRICLIPGEDGVRKIYYSQGMNFCEANNWTDPHVTYRESKDGRFPWRPNSERAVWRNLHDLVNISGSHAPHTFGVYERVSGTDSSELNLCLYGVQTSNASFLDLFHHDLQLPVELLRNDCAGIIGSCIDEAEKLANQLGYSMKCACLGESVPGEIKQVCYQQCEAALWELCREDLAAEEFDPEVVLGKWKLTLFAIGRSTAARMLDRLSLTGAEWIEVYGKQATLNKYLAKLKKEGEVMNGN